MNVYDFDNTIYDGDSTIDFYAFCISRDPSLLRFAPAQALALFRYSVGFLDKDGLKENFYSYLRGIKDIDREVRLFWDKNYKRIKPFYYVLHRPDDVVVSASACFLLSDICARLGIRRLIASEVDIKTGRLLSANCRGAEKLKRLRSAFPNDKIDNFYSDSLSDEPVAKAAAAAYIVKKNDMIDWRAYANSKKRGRKRL